MFNYHVSFNFQTNDKEKMMQVNEANKESQSVADSSDPKMEGVNEGSDSDSDRRTPSPDTEQMNNQNQSFSGLFKPSAMAV